MLDRGWAAQRCVLSLQQCSRFFFFSLFVWPCSLRDYYTVSNRPFDLVTNLITIFPQSPMRFGLVAFYASACLLSFAIFASNRPRTPLTDSEAQNENQADDSGVPGPKQLVV